VNGSIPFLLNNYDLIVNKNLEAPTCKQIPSIACRRNGKEGS